MSKPRPPKRKYRILPSSASDARQAPPPGSGAREAPVPLHRPWESPGPGRSVPNAPEPDSHSQNELVQARFSRTREELVAEAAYERARRREFRGGNPVDDWLEAEAEIDAMLREAAEKSGR